MQNEQIKELGISEPIMRAISDLGYKELTDIQLTAIPLIKSKKDVIGQSQTGTGKTAAFAIPALDVVTPYNKSVEVLVMCPTRELALQVSAEIRKFTKYVEGISVVSVYGGAPITRQIMELRQRAQIVVGTPGRIMDHMRRKTINFKSLKMVILDEADEMLSMGFREDIELILSEAPEERQTVLFSATMSKEIKALTKKFQKDPEHIKIAPEQVTVAEIEQSYYEIPRSKKQEALCRLLDAHAPYPCIIFCNTKKMVDELASELKSKGYRAEGLHGDLKQQSRDHVMRTFKSHGVNILIATDVAARGIDVKNVGSVINYDIPNDIEYYVHRIGRTGRAGKTGLAFTFITSSRELSDLNQIMHTTRSKIVKKSIPLSDEIISKRLDRYEDKLLEGCQDEHLSPYKAMIEKLCEEHQGDLLTVCAALLKMQVTSDGKMAMPSKDDDSDFSAQRAWAKKSDSRKQYADRFDRRDNKRGNKPLQRDHVRSARHEQDANMIPLSINVGKKQNVSTKHILGAVAGETGLAGKIFGRIEILDNNSIVEVPKEHADTVVKAMKDCRIAGFKTVTIKA